MTKLTNIAQGHDFQIHGHWRGFYPIKVIAKLSRDFESFKPVTSHVGVFYLEVKSKRPIRMGIIVYTAGLFC